MYSKCMALLTATGASIQYIISTFCSIDSIAMIDCAALQLELFQHTCQNLAQLMFMGFNMKPHNHNFVDLTQVTTEPLGVRK